MSTNKEINAQSRELIKGIKTKGKEIHNHLLVIASHVYQHGDVSVAAVFLKGAMDEDKDGNSRSVIRVEAVKNWLRMFAMVTWNKEGKVSLNKTMRDNLLSDENECREHFKQAKATVWNKLTPEPKQFGGFDLNTRLKSILSQAQEAEKKAREYVAAHGLPEGYDNTEAFVAHKINVPSETLEQVKSLVK